MDITVLELHVPEANFNAPFAGRSSKDEHDGSDDEDRIAADVETGTDESSGGASKLVAFGVVLGLAVLAWYLRSGSGSGEEVPPEDVLSDEPA